MKKEFCTNIEKVENYQIAKEEEFRKWQIHHRLETHTSEGEKRLVHITKAELIALDMYYERPAEELIYLRLAEHTQIHFKGTKSPEEKKKKISQTLKGHTITQETRQKISATLKGFSPNAETRRKIGITTKERMKEVKRVYSEKYKGKISWNEFQKIYKDGSNAI